MNSVETRTEAGHVGAPVWRAPLNRLEYMTLKVHDIPESVRWYRRALHLQVVDQTEERALLTVGGDDHVDLALVLDRERGRGLHSYAFGIDGPAALEQLVEELTDRGTPFDRIPAAVRGLDGGISLVTPSGLRFDVVASADRVTGTANPGRGDGVAPVDTDHMTVMAPDVKAYATWLHDTLGFEVSDAVVLPDSGWLAAWTHITPQHHDVAVVAANDDLETMHHAAFLAADLNHMGEVADNVCSTGVDRCEWGIGKHGGLGANNYLYLKDPSNNRIEVNSGMATNPYERPTSLYPADEYESFISIWNDVPPPPGFRLGS